MHALLFDLKRAYHTSLSLTRPALHRVGLTPARFDLLYALLDKNPTPSRYALRYSVRQSALCTVLGVSRTTVSRMVRALEQLGLLRRSPVRFGSRRLALELTREGRARVLTVLRQLVSGGHIELMLDSILEPADWVTASACVSIKERLEFLLERIRSGGGDRALLAYPWHPDD